MINAIIQNQNGGTLVWEFPGSIYKLRGELEKIGVNQWPEQILLSDDEYNPVSVKLYSDNDFGNHLLLLFSEKDTLEDVENLTDIIANANELIKEELEQQILQNQYDTKEDLYRNVRRMTYDVGTVSETFYFPLEGNVYDSEYSELLPVYEHFLLEHEYDIRDALSFYIGQDPKNMAEYYNRSGKEKLLLADWDVEEIGGVLYGKVDVRLTEPLTPEETESLKNWIIGQNSDGLGESFEQQEISAGDDKLFVSFWNSSDSYFLYDQEEMDAYIGQSSGMQMNGM